MPEDSMQPGGGGGREVKPLLRELREGYSADAFQEELAELKRLGLEQVKHLCRLNVLAGKVQGPAFARHGYPPGSQGIRQMKADVAAAREKGDREVARLGRELQRLLGLLPPIQDAPPVRRTAALADSNTAPRWPCSVVLLMGSQSLFYDVPETAEGDSEEEAEHAALRSKQWANIPTGGFLATQALARYCAARCERCDLVVLESPGFELSRTESWEGWPVVRAGPEALRVWLDGKAWDVAIACTARVRFLELIHEFEACRRMTVAHDYVVLPFGPWSDPRMGLPANEAPLDEAGMCRWHKAAASLDAILCTSEDLRCYVEDYAPVQGLKAKLCYCADYHYFGDPWVPLPADLPRFRPWEGSGGDRYVTHISPCAAKGIAVLLALADAMPEVGFLAVQTKWTKDGHAAELRKRPNIRVEPATPRVDGIYARTLVLLVPSLWPEGFGLVALEACLRGIPTISTASGGLPEANRCELCFESAAFYNAASGELAFPTTAEAEAERILEEGLQPRSFDGSSLESCMRLLQDSVKVLPSDVAPVPDFLAALGALLGHAQSLQEASERARSGAVAFVESRRDALGRLLTEG